MDTRAYVYRERVAPDPLAPVLVLFHGTGGDENQLFDLGGEVLPNARLIAPRGDVSEAGALRYFRRKAEGVYDLDDLAARTRKIRRFIEDLLPDGPRPKLLGLGYSNGANILANLLFEAPGLFDAAALLHPLIPFEPPAADLSGHKVLITAGRRDPIAPNAATDALAAALRARGAGVELAWHEGGHELRREELAAARRFLEAAAA
jgi:phospholipase/carboxylesterase